MSVDVIAGVMGAVNQNQATANFQVATAQSKGVQVNPAGFASLLHKMGKTNQVADSESNHPLYGGGATPDTTATRKGQAMTKLEGVLMGNMVDAMMPKDENNVYGGGLAGETWRSFAVDQMGQTLAKSDLLNFNRKQPAASQGTAVSLFGNFASPNGMTITPFASQG